MKQTLIVRNSRLYKRELTIPGLKLISTHMVAKLSSNIKQVVNNLSVWVLNILPKVTSVPSLLAIDLMIRVNTHCH